MRTYSSHHSNGIAKVALLVCLATPGLVLAQGAEKAPANVQAAILAKILGFNKGLATGDVTLYVVKCPEFAETMKPAVGKPISDGAKLAAVQAVDSLPADKPAGPAVVYLGDPSLLEACKTYCRQHKVLSIAGDPDLVQKGLTLTVGVVDKKPRILLNLTNSKEEGVDWNPAVMKVASTVN